jgi:hypothetical protein
MAGQTPASNWSNTAQTPVKLRSQTGQTQVKRWSSTGLKLVKVTVNRWSCTGQTRCAGDRAQRFGVAGGVAELEAMAEMRLHRNDPNKLGAEDVRVLLALLRRPLVAARLVFLGLG